MEKSKKELRKSYEYKIYQNELRAFGGVALGTFLLFLFFGIVIEMLGLLVVSVPFFILFVGYGIYDIRLMIRITDQDSNWKYGKAVLTNPEPSFFNRTVCFTAEIEGEDDKVHKIETKPIATSVYFGVFRQPFSELNNKKVLVKYNLKTKEVFVLELL